MLEDSSNVEEKGFSSSNMDLITKGVKNVAMNPSDDSEFKNIAAMDSSESRFPSRKGKDGTIGEGIQFVDPALIAEEQRLKLERKRKKEMNPDLLEQKRAEQRAYEEEIKEKQYKRLMHLLSQSKEMSTFLLNKDKRKELKRKTTTKEEPFSGPKKPKKDDSEEEIIDKPARGRKARSNNKNKKTTTKELASQCDVDPTKDKENVEPVEAFVQSKYFKGELRDYQKVGVSWMLSLYENGLSGILADEMGLGKTIQVIALFAHLIEKNIAGPYLIVVPLSTLGNWTAEFERFAPELPVVVYYGNKEQTKTLKNIIKRRKRIGSLMTHSIVITTYEKPIRDAKFLQEFHWRYIVVDEAQRIKNFNCALFRKLKSISSVNRLVLTGTPIHNNLRELWSLLNFLMPDIFNNLDVFEVWFDAKDVTQEKGRQLFLKQEQEKHVLSSLREILQPFMLRRLKEDACPEIPGMKEVIVNIPLTAIQYSLYMSILKRDLSQLWKTQIEPPIIDVNGVRPKRKCTQKVDLEELSKSSNIKTEDETQMIGNKVVKTEDLNRWNEITEVTEQNVEYLIRLRFGNDIMMYRHVVNHPYIIHKPLNDAGLPKIDQDLIKVSGKMLVLDAILKKLHKNGHKVLLFSTMTMVLDVIEDYLEMTDYQYVRLDGKVKHEDRQNMIDNFQNDPNIFLFMLTTRSGSVGLNLAAADTVIIYDSDWNPQCDLQAMARCHRIGQTKPVVAYRFCTKGTVDEAIINRANAKRVLEKSVIAKETNMVNSEEGLLALKKLLEENCMRISEGKNEVYTEDELNKLLDRSDLIVPKKTPDS